MPSPEADQPPDSLVAGKYRLTQLLGKGGMGSVWEGVHTSLGTRVAVKFIDAQYASSDDIRQRFINEAKAAARLRSKHVVQVYDQGVSDDGRPYIVMEFLLGEALDVRLEREHRLSPQDAARMMLQVARALSKAHEASIVHRDLKPENIFLVHDDEDHTDIVKVVDFGIAKFTDNQGGASTGSTRTGAVLGTPHYMSPEQARGLRSLDFRTDLWSMGVIGYRCIVGRLPFEGEAVGDLLVNICTAEPATPSVVEPTVPAGFDDWVRRALSRDPKNRFGSAMELAEALCGVCSIDVRGPNSTLALSSRRPPGIPASSIVSGRRPDGGAVTEVPLTRTLSGSANRKPLYIALAVGGVAVSVALGFFGTRALRDDADAVAPSREAAPATKPAPAATKAAEPPNAPTVTPALATSNAMGVKQPLAGTAATATSQPAAVATNTAPPAARPARGSRPPRQSKESKAPADVLGY